jgi:hypothetical protein
VTATKLFQLIERSIFGEPGTMSTNRVLPSNEVGSGGGEEVEVMSLLLDCEYLAGRDCLMIEEGDWWDVWKESSFPHLSFKFSISRCTAWLRDSAHEDKIDLFMPRIVIFHRIFSTSNPFEPTTSANPCNGKS